MPKTAPEWSTLLAQHRPALVALRRDFHRHAELSLKEHRTATVIAEQLNAAGLEVRTGLVGGTGVVGILRGDKPGPVVAWRADTDALPLTEALDLPFVSENKGAMHACGHDAHTAIALTLAATLAARRKELTGTVVFLFQPGEEVLGGAQPMIDAGVLEDPPVEAVLGLHMATTLPTGQVAVRPGPTTASADLVEITVRGKGGHGAFPQLSIDPITVAAHIIIGLQSLVTREVAAQDSAVLTMGELHAGTKHNIIPETAELHGSLRALRQEVRDQIIERMGAYASRIAQAYRAEAQLRLPGPFCPSVVNDGHWAGHVHDAAVAELGLECVKAGEPIMASDDMAFFLNARPGCYFMVGAAPSNKPAMPHHHPGFEIDEASLDVGVRVGLRALLAALERRKP